MAESNSNAELSDTKMSMDDLVEELEESLDEAKDQNVGLEGAEGIDDTDDDDDGDDDPAS